MWLYKGTQSHYIALFSAVLLVLLIFTLITTMPHPLDAPTISPAKDLAVGASSAVAGPFSLHSALRSIITLTPTAFPHPSGGAHPPLYQRTDASIQRAVHADALLHAHLHDTDQASHVDSTVEKALVLLFHGCNHAGADWWTLPEDRRNVRLLLAMGYSAIAFTSTDRESGCWDSAWPGGNAAVSNVDVEMVVAGLKAFLEREYGSAGPYPALFTMGASSGGVFTSIVSRALPVMAQVVIIAPGSEAALLMVSQRSTSAALSSAPASIVPGALSSLSTLYPVPPTLFLYMTRDVHWASTARFTSLMSRMRAKGRELGFRLSREESIVSVPLDPVPLSPSFLHDRIDGVSAEDSARFFDAALKEDFVSKAGALQQDPRESGAARYLVERMGGAEWKARHAVVEEELNVLWGQHEMTSDKMDDVVRWMERQRTGKAR